MVSFYHTKMIQLLTESAWQELSIGADHVLVATFRPKLYQFENMT